MTTANQLYAMTPEYIKDVTAFDRDVWCYIPETKVTEGDLYDIDAPLIEVRVLVQEALDYERCWELSSVWFEGKPVMLMQSAGCGGVDHTSRFITDTDAFKAMCNYIISLVDRYSATKGDVIDPDVDNPDLTAFYGWSISPEAEDIELNAEQEEFDQVMKSSTGD